MKVHPNSSCLKVSQEVSAPQNSQETSINDLLVRIYGDGKKSEEVQNIYVDLHRLMPNFNEENMENLCKVLQYFTRLFPNLREEQARLAVDLGKWYQEHNLLKEAMHFYAIALNIEDTEECHKHASAIFIQWVAQKKSYQERLDYASRLGNHDLFSKLLDEMVNYQFWHRGNIKDLLRQASGVLLNKNCRPDFRSCSTKINIFLKNPSHSSVKFITQTYREKFQEYRKCFGENPLSKNKIFKKFKEFFQFFLNDAFILLGPPPCGYDLRAMGSFGREEPCPYSDLEWFILIKDENKKNYFEDLAEIIQLQICSLGETVEERFPIFSVLGPEHRSGLHVDSGANPAGINITNLIGEPQEMARKQASNLEDSTFDFMQSASLANDDSTLFKSYQTEIRSSLNEIVENNYVREIRARKIFKSLQQGYKEAWETPPESQKELDLKKQFIIPLNFLLDAIALYFGIEERESCNVIQELINRKRFNEATGNLLETSVNAFYRMRVRLHLCYQEQRDDAPCSGKHNILFTSEEKKILYQVYWLLLRPLYRGCVFERVLRREEIDLPLEGFNEFLSNSHSPSFKNFIPYFVEYLVENDGSYQVHENNYNRLHNQTALREIYIEELEKREITKSPSKLLNDLSQKEIMVNNVEFVIQNKELDLHKVTVSSGWTNWKKSRQLAYILEIAELIQVLVGRGIQKVVQSVDPDGDNLNFANIQANLDLAKEQLLKKVGSKKYQETIDGINNYFAIAEKQLQSFRKPVAIQDLRKRLNVTKGVCSSIFYYFKKEYAIIQKLHQLLDKANKQLELDPEDEVFKKQKDEIELILVGADKGVIVLERILQAIARDFKRSYSNNEESFKGLNKKNISYIKSLYKSTTDKNKKNTLYNLMAVLQLIEIKRSSVTESVTESDSDDPVLENKKTKANSKVFFVLKPLTLAVFAAYETEILTLEGILGTTATVASNALPYGFSCVPTLLRWGAYACLIEPTYMYKTVTHKKVKQAFEKIQSVGGAWIGRSQANNQLPAPAASLPLTQTR